MVRSNNIPDRCRLVHYFLHLFLNGNILLWMKRLTGDNPRNTVTGSVEAVENNNDQHYSIGTYIQNRRRAAKLSQRKLAELAGVGTRFVSELESGKPTVRMDAVNKVLRVFGKKASYIDIPPVQRMTNAL